MAFSIGDTVRIKRNGTTESSKMRPLHVGRITKYTRDELFAREKGFGSGWYMVDGTIGVWEKDLELVAPIEFKIGDVVEILKKPDCWNSLTNGKNPLERALYPFRGTIEEIKSEGDCTSVKISGYSFDLDSEKEAGMTILEPRNREGSKIKSKKTFMSNMIQKVRIARMAEPQKTFVKAGLADMEGNLTMQGQQLFNEFLLNKFGAEFKTEVVDKIVAECAKEGGNCA